MKALWAILALWMVLLGGLGCRAEEEEKLKAWEVRVADVQKLLSDDVRAIAVDGSGALWFGTFGGGVTRYEPKSGAWTTFTHEDGLADNKVTAIAADGGGSLWFGTWGGGVSRYDPRSGAWTTFTKKNGLADNDVQAIAVDRGSILWFGTWGGGVSRYDPRSGTWTTFTKKNGLAADDVRVIAGDGRGALWVGTSRNGVSRYDPERGAWSTFTQKGNLAAEDVRALAVDGGGALWVGTSSNGVSRYDPKSGAWSTFTEKDGLAANAVGALAVDGEGALWVGTYGAGVSRYDPKSGAWSTFTQKDNHAVEDVRALTVDSGGALWVGTSRNGVSRYDPKSGAWSTFTQKDSFTVGDVRAIAVDGEGALWFGTWGSGVSRYDPKSGAWTMFGLSPDIVRALAVDGGGALWFGTYGAGVSRYDPKSGAWSTFTQKDGLAANAVGAIAVDGGGALWFGTGGSGVSRYDPKSGAWSTFTQKDGLAANAVGAIAVDGGGALWFGTDGSGVSRYDPKSGAWSTFTHKDSQKDGKKDSLAANAVGAIAVDGGGALWFGTDGSGVSRYDPKSGAWSTFTQENGLAGNSVNAIAVDNGGALWLGTGGGGISRYDPKSGVWSKFTPKDSLVANPVNAIAVDKGGALWFGTYGVGLSRVVLSGTTEVGALFSVATPPAHRSALVNHEWLVLTRPAALSYRRQSEPSIALPSVPGGAEARILAPGPDGSVWVGTELGGLLLRKLGQDLQLTKEKGLPSMTVTALAPFPHDPAKVWVGTSGGAALVRLRDQELVVDHAITWESMPSGPVDALAPADDGSVFLAYNAIPAERFFDSELVNRRTETHVWKVSPTGSSEKIKATVSFINSDVRVLAFSARHGLWAGTSTGLFVAAQKDKRGCGVAGLDPAGFKPVVTDGGLPIAPIRNLVIAPGADDTLWMSFDQQGNAPPSLVGFHPGTDSVYTLTHERGIPRGGAIDDLTFTDDGELVVLVGSELAKGRVFVSGTSFWTWTLVALGLVFTGAGGTTFALRRNSLAARIRRRPATLRELPLSAVPSASHALRRARALDEVWTQLDLPASTLSFVEPLASSAPPGASQLHALAELLGMDAATTAEVTSHPHGLTLLTARLPYPAPLRGHPIAIAALDLAVARRADPARVRETLQAALTQAGHRFELPFLLLANGDVAQDILPANLAGLHLGEAERKALLFSRSPAHTLAGLLHTRGLLALSPYDTSGAVKEEQMFFGRVALLRELLLASSVQQIIVGPRRVGKTSLLQSLRRELPARRPDTEVVFLDLLGIRDPLKAARNLARQLDVELPKDADPETLLADLLRSRFQRADKKGVILIDEADGLVEADAQRGFPLLGAMRSLQAEGICSFVLAGYLYLYREALNQRSPLYNFATLRLLGPLEPEAATNLALVPMQRLGVQYADPTLPAQIAARTGGYPSFVQLLCDALLKELKGGDLTLTATHLTQAERSARVSGQLGDMFRLNAGRVTQIAVYGLLDQEAFTRADAEQTLSRALRRAAPVEAVEQALLELRVFGFAVEQEGRFTWAIPLLRETLQASDPARAAEQLVEELEQDRALGGEG